MFPQNFRKIGLREYHYFFNQENVLLPTQYGFWRNYSTSHAIIDILSTCYDNIEKKLYSGFVQLDLAKAFDTMDHYIFL